MHTNRRKKAIKTRIFAGDSPWLSPWLIIGSVSLLAVILAVIALRNLDREKRFMQTSLTTLAHVLMESLEAGSRTGMLGRMGWGRGHLQLLMEQMAQEPHVLYLRLVDQKGRVVVSSNPQEAGREIPPTGPSEAGGHAFSDFQGKKAFELTRPFDPWARCALAPRSPCSDDRGAHAPGMGHGPGGERANPFPEAGPLRLVVGLDATPLQEALRQDLAHNVLLLAILFLLGAAGLIALFWAHGYRLARKSLRTMQAMTDAIFARMPIGLIATDRRGIIRRTNPAAASLLGPRAGPGQTLDALPALESLRRRLEKGEDPVEDNIVCDAEHGKKSLPLLIHATGIKGPDEETSGFVFLLSDMTAVHTLEQKLRRHERLAALGKLASGVAHEIRNPLSSIKGFAAILARKAGDDPTAQDVARTMTHEVDRLNRVISELLEFARPAELDPKPVRLRDIIRHSLKLVEKDAHHAGVQLAVDIVPPDLEAVLDADRFAQVLLNLYLNAIQAMERGGALTVRALMEPGVLRVEVEDSGPGIAPEALGHIFDPYFTTKPNGVGLGLSIVHKIVEAHGGDIFVDKAGGDGTRFVIRIPQKDAADASELIRPQGKPTRQDEETGLMAS